MTGSDMDILKSPLLDRTGCALHGFFGRRGGVSGGVYGELNCGYGSQDQRDNVARNRRRVAAAVGVPDRNLVTVYQVHSPRALAVEAPFAGEPPEADALVTTVPGLAIGVLTADCAPVLFADTTHRVIAAAHAGWKGALDGVLEATLATMQDLGARRDTIVAAVGPCIHQVSYEVGPEFHEMFLARDGGFGTYFHPGNGDRWQFDLPGFVADRLARAGISQVDRIDADTLADETRFFSYRRTCHRGEPDYGRQVSAIALTA